jgi:hypothetical protein
MLNLITEIGEIFSFFLNGSPTPSLLIIH